uniref:NADH-ubiquinone oxidoreductase chain 4L n=1 Tax=Donacia distincta TaxID=131636 RepID=U3KZU1_9CUCU|nr:NADH dehydrogenase subunit 4L [Donacia distincta]
MLIYFYISLIFLFSGLLMYSFNYKHLLIMLLSLEFMVISLYFLLFNYLSLMSYEFFFSLIFLSMSVMESVLGLSIMVYMIRAFGNDYMLSFTFLW